MKCSKNFLKLKSFKKRYKLNYNYKLLSYGSTGVYFLKNSIIENIYLFDLKRKFKVFLNK